jgi:quercetin dioxygenase-like cupin family protein/catechol 2,3-dioxygenase-like lactoylglutathione lyase family enzyme
MTVIDKELNATERDIASEPTTSPAWWFLGTLAVLRNPAGAPRTPVVMELTVPPGGSPPQHVHEALDDSFLLLDGELVVRCGERTFVARPGAYVVLPQGVPHTFRVTSATPARLLLVHADDSFLRFVEALGAPASEHVLPPPGEFDVDLDALMRASAEHGAPMVGPSLEQDEARAVLAAQAGPQALGLGPVNHVAIGVSDPARSARWYAETLGLTRVGGEAADDGHVTLVSPSGGWVLALTGAPVPAVEHIAFGCPDRPALCAWHDRLADAGAAPGTITDADYGSGFVVRDPDGLEVELFAPASM